MKDIKSILTMGNLLWCLKLERTNNVLKAMKEEHESYKVERMLNDDESRCSLLEMVNIDIQKPVKGEGYGILLPEGKKKKGCYCSMRFTGIKIQVML
ncbi:hypothetical protein BCV72DRAFT_28163 [Rhizopus microsporus var. microsporus]|uniref:Uncharacterized protein n=2 Tax=Rhizopus microsporus TaxID=58291 RepID=A0A2G4SUG8_RHIZD|nr:uncharacterized protein RHIMIDRAFT_237323 [Rhizopus microsporus ATCC 52813]ORE03635.1 hypothetical protein BCV72DRAFT_28163 [Rhizopus microsporus var. microsporus]PHZ12392.1 hypothetical protein RHIMIDRAFT_237323 [Rhizopus microsporus ATCC 52813]